MKRALVTGASGFIGSEVVRHLLNEGIAVRALLRKTSPKENLKGVEYEAALGDLSDFESLKNAVEGVDYVFHIAGVVSARNREDYFRHNALGTANLARACVATSTRVERFVYVSSLAASGPAKSLKPVVEDDVAKPISAYGESKLAGERELEKWAAEGKFPYTIVRPPAVYGPRDRGIFELVKFVKNGILPVFPSTDSSGDKFLSVVYVDDLVRGILLAGTAKDLGEREVFFVTGDGIHSWSTMLGMIAENLGKKPLRVPLPSFVLTGVAAAYTLAGWALGRQFPLTLDKLNELRPDYWICANDRAKKILNFQPQFDLKTGVSRTVAWYKENGWI